MPHCRKTRGNESTGYSLPCRLGATRRPDTSVLVTHPSLAGWGEEQKGETMTQRFLGFKPSFRTGPWKARGGHRRGSVRVLLGLPASLGVLPGWHHTEPEVRPWSLSPEPLGLWMLSQRATLAFGATAFCFT